MTPPRFALAFLALFAFTACSAIAQDDPAEDTKAAEEAPLEEEAKAPKERPLSVTLLEAGEEPHRTLRYDVKPGDEQTFVVTHRNTATQVVLGMTTPPTRDPDFRVTVESTVKSVAEDGNITLALRFADAEAVAIGNAPLPTSGHRRAMLGMKGKTASMTIDRRGFVQSFDFGDRMSGSAGLLIGTPHEIIEEGLRTSVVALPEVPVGQGAKWRVDEVRRYYGIVIERSTTYTITRMDGDQIELDAEVSLKAGKQPIEMERQQALELNSYAGKLSGKDVLVLTKAMPTSVERAGKLDMEIQINVHRMTQEVETVSGITHPSTFETSDEDDSQEDQ